MEVRRQEVLLRFSCHTMAVQLRRVAAQPLAGAMHRQLEDTWHIHFQGMSQDDCETTRFHRLFTGLHYHYAEWASVRLWLHAAHGAEVQDNVETSLDSI